MTIILTTYQLIHHGLYKPLDKPTLHFRFGFFSHGFSVVGLMPLNRVQISINNVPNLTSSPSLLSPVERLWQSAILVHTAKGLGFIV